MGTVNVLPIDTKLAALGGHFGFTATVAETSYEFDFRYLGAVAWWHLTITNTTTSEIVFQTKIVYGQAYAIEDVFSLAFIDFQEVETEITKDNLGEQVQAVVEPIG